MKKLILAVALLAPLTSLAYVVPNGHPTNLANISGQGTTNSEANYAGVTPPATSNEVPCPTCPSKGAWNGTLNESWALPQFNADGSSPDSNN